VSAELIEAAAEALGPPLLSDVVFLGGASIHLWVSDRAAPATRATNDVDVISAVAGKAGYYKLGERLRERGFSEASDSPVICRWHHTKTGLVLDVMPADKNVLGFANQWYEHAILTSDELSLASGTRIRAAAPPSIVATKLAAWHSRGSNDMLRSLDLHDVLVLIDGREELITEIREEPVLSRYISNELAALRSNPYFIYLTESALHGYGALVAQRAEEVYRRIDVIISSATT
jgi:predicted nucleotidyltransferase